MTNTLDYNTGREKLLLREYGRNIQELVKYAITIEDDEERKRVAYTIIEIMGHLNPQMKNSEQFKHKIWDHIFTISDNKLNIESPFPRPISVQPHFKTDKRVPYPQSRIKSRHYGKNILKMIKKAKEMEDPEKKQAYTEVIANYMKLVYQNWNRENVADDQIKQDIRDLSNGELVLDESVTLTNHSAPQQQQPQRKKYSSKGGKNYGRGGGHQNYSKRKNRY